MAFLIAAFNVKPNREWFIKLSDSGSAILAELFLTEAHAQTGTERQAHGTSSGYGVGMEITLENDSGAAEPVTGKYSDVDAWHLKASGESGDPAKIFRMPAFEDLLDISDAIYLNAELGARRAVTEIDAHTHLAKIRRIDLAVHLPQLEPGETPRLNSARESINELGQCDSFTISGSVSGQETKLTTSLEMRTYQAMTR